MVEAGQGRVRIAAALLAACTLQGCGGANVLAAIDGPFIPPSRREASASAAVDPPTQSAPVVAPAAEPVREPEPVVVATLAGPPPSRIGPDFLDPAPEPATPPESLAPPATAAEALPGSTYAAFHGFAVERLAGSPTRDGRRSMMLADPPSLDPALAACGNGPPAVLIDLDPAHGLLPLVSSNRIDPALAALLADLRMRGVAIYWITGHSPGAANAIRQRLVGSALDPSGDDALLVNRFASETKQQRRRDLGETHCLLAILGDYRGDFDELYDFLRDPAVAAPLEVHVNRGWFLAPLPLG